MTHRQRLDREARRQDGPSQGEPGVTEEERLHRAAARGERDAIDSVWRRNRRWIASVLAAHAPRDSEIEDLLQDVAATFVVKAREIRDAASLRGWLRVVAVNAARMAARSRSAERRAIARIGTENRVHASGAPRDAEARETLALVARLPSQYAEPLLLQASRGLSQREIAELLELPETTIETRLARARRMLRRLASEAESPAEQGRGDDAIGQFSVETARSRK